jgi:DNA sulfur modification protein DndE
MTIRTSENSKNIISTLTSSLSLGTENIIARIAIVYSLKNHVGELDLNILEDSKGKEYTRRVLLGVHDKTYVGMICAVHKIRETSPLLPKILKFHLDRGLKMIEQFKNERPRINSMELIVGLANENFDVAIH